MSQPQSTEEHAVHICNSKLATRPILYTDSIKGEQTLRDDLWAVTTEELNNMEKEKVDAYQSGLQEGRREKVTGETSDGYHTFNELYEFRKLYNAALFNEWYKQDKYSVCKSRRHSDGEECFGGGWFIVVAYLPTGQISNHYELKDWDLFKCVVYDKAPEWDGHTEKDVLERLSKLI